MSHPTIEHLKASMIAVRGGKFTLGDTHTLYRPFFGSRIGTSVVILDDFHICDHPVTNAEWCAVTGEECSAYESKLPKTDVTWHDVLEFILRLNKLTGWNFRLPTEAEWEYAARGGELTHDYVFPGSTILDNVGWYAINSQGVVHNVKQLQSNELGIYDMAGNVREWCADIYASEYIQGERISLFSTERKPVTNPHGAMTGAKRSVRGGSYRSRDTECWLFFRDKMNSTSRAKDLGFRLAY